MAHLELYRPYPEEDDSVLSTLGKREITLQHNLEQPVFGVNDLLNLKNTDHRIEKVEKLLGLTYGDLVYFPEQNSEDQEIQPGFSKDHDRAANLVLKEGHIEMLRYYVRTRQPVDVTPTRLAGYPVNTLDLSVGKKIIPINIRKWLNPKFENYTWFRGNRVKISSSQGVVILVPWVTIDEVGGSPFPALYSKGELQSDELVDITTAYVDHLKSNMFL